jgi:YegS/Rv2252/BmrU family lipid kinase
MTRTCCLVVNPAAGGGRSGRLLPAVGEVLAEAGVRHQICTSASLEHARELAEAAAGRGDVVVAFGGDGMVGGLAGTVAGAGGVFAIVPAGRGNDFARTLSIPFDAAEAARVIASGRERPVDLIAVGAGGDEAVVAGSVYLGIPAVAAAIAAGSRFPPGEMAYPAAGLRAVAGWRTTSFRLELEAATGADGETGPRAEEFSGGVLVVANSRYFGAGMKVAPQADVSDGLLDVVFLRGGSKLAMLRGLGKLKDGSHVSMSHVSTSRARAVTVTAGRAVPGGADGEALACASPLAAGSPLRIRALPGVLRVIGPDSARRAS